MPTMIPFTPVMPCLLPTNMLVAPDASHALHMPTHIFVAFGMDKVIDSTSNQAPVRKKKKSDTTTGLSFIPLA
jgi:hypothetical protein